MGHFLVTGSAGFIGAHVVTELLARGHTVTGVDSFDGSYNLSLKFHRERWYKAHPRYLKASSDVRALPVDGVEPGIFDAIIHLAGRAGVRQSVDRPAEYLTENIAGMVRVLELVRAGIAKRLVYASSSSVYAGPSAETIARMRETGDVGPPMRVSYHDDHPRTPYAASKRILEQIADVYAIRYGVKAVGLRYFSVYGPAGRPDSRASVFQYIRQIVEGEPVTIFGDPVQARDFTWIDDVVRMTLNAATFDDLSHPVYNVGSACPLRVIDVITTIGNYVGKTPTIRYETHATDTFTTYAYMGESYLELMNAVDRTIIHRRNRSYEMAVIEYLGRCVEWYMENRAWASKIGPDSECWE